MKAFISIHRHFPPFQEVAVEVTLEAALSTPRVIKRIVKALMRIGRAALAGAKLGFFPVLGELKSTEQAQATDVST